MFCNHCGEKNNDGARYCSKCGKLAGGTAPQPIPNRGTKFNYKPRKPIYQRVWFWLIIVFVVVPAIITTPPSEDTNETVNVGSTEINREVSEKPTETTEKPTETAEKPVIEKVPLMVNSDTLFDELKNNALKAAKTYKGEYVEVKGRLSNIDSSGDYFSISSLTEAWSFDSILCKISEEHLDAVMNFKKDQTVTVVGTITQVGEVLGYTLEVDYIK